MTFDIDDLQSLNGCIKRVFECVAEGRVLFSPHALKRMSERDVDLDDIAAAIKNGHCTKQSELGRVVFAIRDISVVIEISKTGVAHVVTVWKPELLPPKYVSRNMRKRSLFEQRSNSYIKAEEKAHSLDLNSY